MTSMITGLPDRYRPLDEVGPDEVTATGVIRCWRAKDRVLNRDVAIRVHTPGGAPAHDWIARALTAGGLATPALAMVYDAAEGGEVAGATGDPGAAYVVNEWIDGETLTQRLSRGPLPEREARTMLRRLAEGVAEAHRVGLALGGLTPDLVVLRPNGLVGVRAVPAASGTIQGDITALGALLEACLTGRSGGAGHIAQADLAALVRRAQSTEPGQSLSSAAAMAALLADRPRTPRGGPTEPVRTPDVDSGWLKRLRERRPETEAATPQRTRVMDAGASAPAAPAQQPLPPVPPTAPAQPTRSISADEVAPAAFAPAAAAPPASGRAPLSPAGPGPATDAEDDELIKHEVFGEEPFTQDEFDGPVTGSEELDPQVRQRRRLITLGLPLLALALVIGLAWWLGSSVLSVAGSVKGSNGSSPPAITTGATHTTAPAVGGPVAIKGASVFDPFGDGQPENNNKVPLSYDGNPSTAWDTLIYKRPAFGNLKPGVGVLYDLGTPQQLSGVAITTTMPGATMEIRTGDQPKGSLDSFHVVGSETVDGTTEIHFATPVTTRYVLLWVTNLGQTDKGFQADVAEIVLHSAR